MCFFLTACPGKEAVAGRRAGFWGLRGTAGRETRGEEKRGEGYQKFGDFKAKTDKAVTFDGSLAFGVTTAHSFLG